jgi:hypothetical protein
MNLYDTNDDNHSLRRAFNQTFYTEVPRIPRKIGFGQARLSWRAALETSRRFQALSAIPSWRAPVSGTLNLERNGKNPPKRESDQLLPCCGFLLCGLFRWHWSRHGSSRCCFFSSQISQPPFALVSYSVLLSHGISID